MPDPIQNAELTELQGKLTSVQDRVARCFEEAAVERDGTTVHDFKRVKVYGEGLSTVAIAEKVRADNAEMTDLGEQIETLKEAQGAYERLSQQTKAMEHPTSGGDDPKHAPNDGGRQGYKSLGQRITDSPGWTDFAEATSAVLKADRGGGYKAAGGSLFIPDVSAAEFKTLFETSAGWAPESVRSGVVVPATTRPIQLLDIMPMGPIGQAAAVYMEETTRTHNAAETSEGGTYQESVFALTERSKTVRKITDSIPVTDEQLEDVAMAQGYLQERIRFGLRQRLDNQMLNGSDVAPQLGGILNEGSIQTQAKGADPVPDAFFKAMTLLRLTGRVNPTHHIMHQNDWQAIRLLRTADGIYIWGNPSESGPERMWGLPVVQSDAIPENTGLCGAFEGAWIQLLERRGIVLESGYTGSQFVEGKQTIRASMRAVLVIYRPAAFCTVTGI